MKEFIRKYKLPVAIACVLVAWPVVVLWTSENESEETSDRKERLSHRNIRDNNRGTNVSHDPVPPGRSAYNQYYGQLPFSVNRPNQRDDSIIGRGTHRPDSAVNTSPGSPKTSPSSLRLVLTRLRAVTGGGSRMSRGQIQSTVTSIESFRSANSLADEDRDTALLYLQSDPPEGMTQSQHHWVVDELITTLRADGADNVRLTRSLSNLYQDVTRHTTVRDYALQHLGHLTNEGGDTKLIKQTLQGAVQEKQGTLAGTALLALYINSYVAEDVPLTIAKDSTYDLRSRITALQVAGKQQNTDAIPFVAETAQDTTQPTALRLAAIATLADLNATDQQQVILRLSNSDDNRISVAANATLRKLQSSH